MWFYVLYNRSIDISCILLEHILLESKSYELAVGNKMMRILINAYPERIAKMSVVIHERLISAVLYLTNFLGSLFPSYSP